jgi:uncharacterized protein YoxC
MAIKFIIAIFVILVVFYYLIQFLNKPLAKEAKNLDNLEKVSEEIKCENQKIKGDIEQTQKQLDKIKKNLKNK